MKHIQPIKILVLAFIICSFILYSLTPLLRVEASAGSPTPAPTPQSTAVKAAEGENNLLVIANNCHDMKENGDLWIACQGRQNVLNDNLSCSDNMFYQKSDSQDSSAQTGIWFTNQRKLAGCVDQANKKIEFVKSKTCASVQHGDGVDDSDNWSKCEDAQNQLNKAIGCTANMFKKKDNTHFTQNDASINNCQQRVNQVLGVKIIGANGTNSKTVKQLLDSGDFDSVSGTSDGDSQADCDAKLNSILSWILCPVIDMGINTSDYVFKNFIEPFMEDVPISTDPRDGTYKAWQQFRIIANILLIGTLLAIVYAQVKGDR